MLLFRKYILEMQIISMFENEVLLSSLNKAYIIVCFE